MSNNNLLSEGFYEGFSIYANRLKNFFRLLLIGFFLFAILILVLPETGYSKGLGGLILLGAVITTGISVIIWKLYQTYYNPVADKQITENTLTDFSDKTLLRAWRIMFRHDLKAVAARQNFRQTRFSLISITVLSTAVAFLAIFFHQDSVWYKLLAFIALSLPIAGSTYVNYIQRFSKITIWLKHRVVAERIRAETYEYRMKAGKYKPTNTPEETPIPDTEKLNEAIYTIEKELDTEETYVTINPKQIDSKIAKQLKKENILDIGDALTFEKYLTIRGIDQRDWYEGRIKKNYNKTERYASFALIVQMGGAISTALILAIGLDSRLIILATVTNALAFAINSWTTVEMTAQVYSIFNIARKQLSKHLGDWDAFIGQDTETAPIPNDKKLEEQLKIVEAIEATLAEERENWFWVGLQALSSNDQALFQAVEDLQKDGSDKDKEDKK
jgi:hypothetical protein